MPPVLRTQKDQPAVSLAGVGLIPANGVGGVLLDRAAGELRELQDADGQPLEGAALKKAAKAFVDDRGLTVGEISDDKVAKLPELAGGFPDRPPAVEVAQSDPRAALASTSDKQPVVPLDPTVDQPDEAPAAPAAPAEAQS